MSPRRGGPSGAGERDRYITIQSLTESQGTSGFPMESWTTLAMVWAKKTDSAGNRFTNQRFVSDQISEPFDTEWEIPYSENMDPALVSVPKTRRVVFQGRVHDIVWAGEIGRHRAIQLMTLSGGLVT